MGKFFSDDMIVVVRTQSNPLNSVVRKLSPSAKQAFLAAAEQGRIARGTWNGCAFNQGGKVLGDASVRSITRAAEVFGMKESDVSNFIRTWDSLYVRSDWTATRMLKEAIENIGLFSEPGRTFRFRAYTSEETKMREEFDALVAANEVQFTDEAVDLLVMV